MRFLLLLALVLTVGCSTENSKRKSHTKEERISRKTSDSPYLVSPARKRLYSPYPWEMDSLSPLPPITKEYFRCRGCSLNPPGSYIQNGEKVPLIDCGGSTKHSLPLRNGKEFVYPILIELLNYIQAKTGKSVIITSGHRCPQHNTYIDPSTPNSYSKHQIGAEVSFYVSGYENDPHAIVKVLLDYYAQAKYAGKKEFQFQRYEKPDTDVSTKPWFNKEIYLKLYTKQEGRSLDNRHSYPYLSIQVRYDSELNERVSYSWEKAHKNYLRN